MRILIDLQGAQTGSRFRGIGRSSLARAKSIIRNRGEHEVLLLLNGLFEDTIEPIRRDFSAILPAENILVFSVPSPVSALAPENAWRIEAAELIREWMIAALAPVWVLITSLFEGPSDPAIVSIGRLTTSTRTAVILHDLIPFLDPETYLGDPAAKKWYYSKIEYLRSADLLLAVSDSARREAVDDLGFDGSRALSVSSAADESFAKANASPEVTEALLKRIGVRHKFIMNISSIEPSKNFGGMIRAFGLLPKAVRDAHQLVLAGDHDPDQRAALRRLADGAGLGQDEMIFAGYVSDRELIGLYSQCALYVMPSLHEGFGLPALEAMSCGAAAIGSNTTSIPEVIGRKDALFDPHSDRSMAALMERALTDAKFWRSLKRHAGEWSKRFSWDRSAQLSLRAMEKLAAGPASNRKIPDVAVLLGRIAAITTEVRPDRKDLVAVADSVAKNEKVISRSERGSNGAVVRHMGRRLEAAKDDERRYDEAFVENLYRVIHGREPDPDGLQAYLTGLRSGRPPHELVAEFLNSEEFSSRWARRRNVAGDRTTVGGPPSDPAIEVIRHQVWGREDRPRILLLKLDHIGDFVLTLDALRLIRDTWPKAHITLVCGVWNHSIAEQLGWFDRIVDYNFYTATAGDDDQDRATKIAAYHELELGAYDLAVDLRCYDDNRMLLSHTEAKYRAGYDAVGVPLDLALPVGSENDMMAHIGGRTLALAAAVAWTYGTPAGGARAGLLNGRVPVRFFKDGVVAAISPGTRNALRSWGRERFAELASLLCARGFRIVLIGAEADRSDTQFISASIPKKDVIDLAGTLPIADIPPVFAGLDLFIGGETGTTHMAAVMGVPTLCLHSGVTNVDSWRPVGPHVVTLRGNVSCSPCFLGTIEECRWGKRCMDIPPARVAAEAVALREHLASTSPGARSPVPIGVGVGTVSTLTLDAVKAAVTLPAR